MYYSLFFNLSAKDLKKDCALYIIFGTYVCNASDESIRPRR